MTAKQISTRLAELNAKIASVKLELEGFIEAIEDDVELKQGRFDSKSESWKEGDLGDKLLAEIDEANDILTDLNSANAALEEVIDFISI